MNGSASRSLLSEERASRWARNAEAVRRVGRRPPAEIRSEGPEPPEILPARSGPPTLRYRGEFIHSPFHPVLEAKGLAQPAIDGHADVVLVVGLGLGYQVREVLDRTAAKIIVYEPDRVLMAGLMRRVDYGALFVPGRVSLTHDEDHFLEAMEATLRIGVRVSWLVLPGYAKLFAEAVGRARGRAHYRLSMFRRQVEIPVTESRRVLFHSLENLPWLWNGRWARPKPDRQVWLNAVVLNGGCAGRLPGDVTRAIEERAVVAATCGPASGFRPHLRIGVEAVAAADEALAVLPLDADPSAFKTATGRPVVYMGVHDDFGRWAAGILAEGGGDPHLPLGLSAPADAALLCGTWFDRTFWIDLAPLRCAPETAIGSGMGNSAAPYLPSESGAYDRLADRRFLAEIGKELRAGGGALKLVLDGTGDGEIDQSSWISLGELRTEIAALPTDHAAVGGDWAGKFLAEPSWKRDDLRRLYDALIAERRALNEFSSRLGGHLEKWGSVRSRESDEETPSTQEERRLMLESFISDLAEAAAPSRLISAVVRPLVLRILRPWSGPPSDADRLSCSLESVQALLLDLVGDLPRSGVLLERSVFELQERLSDSGGPSA